MKTFVIIVITSFSVFPFFFSFLPSVNTKMMMAALGLLFIVFNQINGRNGVFDKSFITVSFAALCVGAISFISMVINDTKDDSYLSFLISVWVWWSAAYFYVNLINLNENRLDASVICWYLFGAALFQCVCAILIYKFSFIRNITDTYVTGERYMGVGIGDVRLYGPGCALDVGGGRIGAILIFVSYIIIDCIKKHRNKIITITVFISYILIAIIGNMMGRTATIGALLGITMFIAYLIFDSDFRGEFTSKYSSLMLISILFSIGICIVLYNTDASAKRLLRFGFEGFFNYFETGKFETNSTDMLQNGMIFPDNIHTWIIGDGYMAGTANDPYYIGPTDYGFYKNTDAGYSRFLFYFGIIGLLTIIGFFLTVTRECIQKSPKAKYVFLTLLLCNLIIWIKVSTDLFVVFAPFLCITRKEEDEAEKWEGSLQNDDNSLAV